MPPLLTVGHGPQSQEELTTRLVAAGVDAVVDVRRFPASRHSPHLHRDEVAQWLPRAGVTYRWEQRLGGRRTLTRGEPVVDSWWRVTSFQAYAAYTRTVDFTDALAELLLEAVPARVAVMCSELVWWRCHRRLIADVAVLAQGVPVEHLMPDGSLRPHLPADGAKVTDTGQLVWPADPAASDL